MNTQTEIILEKMVDHFGEWEEVVEKKKIRLKKRQKKVLKEKEFKANENLHLDNVHVRERRDELLIFIEELKLLNSNEDTRLKASNDIYTKTRKEELLYVKKVLQAEINNSSFIVAY